MKEDPYAELCIAVIEAAAKDYLFWKNEKTGYRIRKKWREVEMDGKSAEEFFRRPNDPFFAYLHLTSGLRKEQFCIDLCEKLID